MQVSRSRSSQGEEQRTADGGDPSQALHTQEEAGFGRIGIGVLTWRYGGWVENPRKRGLRSREVRDAVQVRGTCPPRVRQQDGGRHLG